MCVGYTRFSGNPISGANRPDQNQPIQSHRDGENQLDPLLDLVIASESPGSQREALLKIAEEARIASEPKIAVAALDRQILEKFGLGIVMPEVVNSGTVKTREFLEESSDDICASKCKSVVV